MFTLVPVPELAGCGISPGSPHGTGGDGSRGGTAFGEGSGVDMKAARY